MRVPFKSFDDCEVLMGGKKEVALGFQCADPVVFVGRSPPIFNLRSPHIEKSMFLKRRISTARILRASNPPSKSPSQSHKGVPGSCHSCGIAMLSVLKVERPSSSTVLECFMELSLNTIHSFPGHAW